MNRSRTRTALSLLALTITSGCGWLVGIEDLHEGAADGGTGGTTNVDAALDRNQTGGTGGGTGGASGKGGTGGASGSAGSGGNAGSAGSAGSGGGAGKGGNAGSAGSGGNAGGSPQDGSADITPVGDVSSDGRPIDVATDIRNETAPPDVGTPESGTDGTPDVGSPDTGTNDGGIIDAGTDRITLTVHGRVIDFWRHVVPNAPVTIGGTTVSTDASGDFTVSNVTAPYDVAITVNPIVNSTASTFGWLYRGLTRTDPTLQVDLALPGHSSGDITVSVTSIDFTTLPVNDLVTVGFGGPDGMFAFSGITHTNNISRDDWIGPAATSFSGHALHWTRAGTGFGDLPTGYKGYDTHPLAVQDGTESNVAFDVPDQSITSGVLTGTVTGSASGGARHNDLWVSFASGAAIQLVSETSQPTNFSYLVPSLAGASITLAADQGDTRLPYAVVHKSNLVAGQTGVTLQVPDAPTQIAPGGGATGVNQSTVFSWSGSAKVFVWRINFVNEAKAIFVVTSEKQGQIPTLPNGPVLTGNAPYLWRVQTNGSYQSVDEATGPDGMLDPYVAGYLWGPPRNEGSFTSTVDQSFTSAP